MFVLDAGTMRVLQRTMMQLQEHLGRPLKSINLWIRLSLSRTQVVQMMLSWTFPRESHFFRHACPLRANPQVEHTRS